MFCLGLFIGFSLGGTAMLFALSLAQAGSRADEIERELWEKRMKDEG